MAAGDYFIEFPKTGEFTKLTPSQDPYDEFREAVTLHPTRVVQLTYYEPGATEPEIIERCEPDVTAAEATR